MTPKTLSTAQVALVNRSSQQAVVECLAGLQQTFASGRWLMGRNRYRLKTIEKLDADISAHRIRKTDLCRYIAVSGFLHCADGWAFLGRALASQLAGDKYRCCHMAYYAELRAAIGLLAAEGIGVFNYRHVCVHGARDCTVLPGQNLSTHEATWLLFKAWAARPAASDLLFNSVRPNGISLADWLDAFQLPSKTSALWAAEELRQWGLDIKYLAQDRAARNSASYRPNQLARIDEPALSQDLAFASDLWLALEPTSPSWLEIDSHILKMILVRLFAATTPISSHSRASAFASRVRLAVMTLGLSDKAADSWIKLLTSTAGMSASGRLLRTAAREPGVVRTGYHREVLARATVLLRIATAANARLLEEAAVSKESLAFWWRPLGEVAGFWSPPGYPSNFSDLWADIRVVLDSLEGASEVSDTRAAIARFPSPLLSLGGCERALLWTLISG
jgi:hypothetical protein